MIAGLELMTLSLYLQFSENVSHAEIDVIAFLVRKWLVFPRSQETAPLPCKVHVRRVLVNYVSCVSLILVPITRAQIGVSLRIDAIGKVGLPFRSEIELQLRPAAKRPDAVLASRADREHRLSCCHAIK